ncbi:sentrin-specific protease 1-like isoform X2 [Hibiscus syriacus]|uniref:Sentrin-specific protease 1-like isoform X2 n=1 Tax=Hibiscus syriacus TaxID=106335 RepID=A0A6A2Y1E9_HIBSY|nr:probable ubiquitin-like-specific protease 2A [Hibiscus syriacus]KAE8663377.1 sentrin-specific protease 1-like isoform X2 [Hibiscus syriacus]
MPKRTPVEIQVIGDGEEEEEEDSTAVIHSTVSASGRFSPNKRSRRRINNGNTRQQGMLNSNQFSDCFEIIWKSFSDDRRDSFTYLDCLWFSWYMDELYKERVLAWIGRKQIFSKKYVFVPIVHWSHWNLLILCNFDEPLQSKNQTTCMLLLDSLQMSGPRRLEPMIRKFVLDIFEAEKRPVTKEAISKIPLLVPKVPQQRNGEECGSFVLFFISLFMESAPENFSITGEYPYFLKEDWFSPQDLDCFSKRFKPSTL